MDLIDSIETNQLILKIPPEFLDTFVLSSNQPRPLAAITPQGIIVGNPTNSAIQHLSESVGGEIARAVLDIVATGKGGNVPVRSPGPLWEVRWYNIEVMPWHQDVQGLIQTYLIVLHEVTALKLGEAVTSLLHDEDAPFACIYTDAYEQPGRIVRWLGGCRRMFGYSAEYARGRQITLVKEEADIRIVRAATDNGRLWQGFLPYRHQNRSIRWCHATLRLSDPYRVGLIADPEPQIRDAAALLKVILGDTLKDFLKSPGSKPSITTAEASQSPEQWLFAPSGGVYQIAGFGESGHLPAHYKGLRHIARLIQTPGKPVLMLELIGADQRLKNDRRSRQPVDPERLREINDELSELRSALDEARQENNSVEACPIS